MEQIRVGTKVGTRKTPYHDWRINDHKTLNSAKKANGLNSVAAPKFPATMESRRVADRRINADEVKEELRRFQRRAA